MPCVSLLDGQLFAGKETVPQGRHGPGRQAAYPSRGRSPFMVGYVAGNAAQRVPLGAAWAVRFEALAPTRRRL
jgi:hypothetical protein